MQFAMGLRLKWTFLFVLCILLIKTFNSKDISSTIPEQGSQVCNVFLVTGIYGVPDEYLSASSEYSPKYAAKYGRINTTFVYGFHGGTWAAKTKSKDEFIQVQLKQLSLIQAIQTQGRNNTGDPDAYAQYVTSYNVSYSTNGTTWLFVNDPTGNPKMFPGNNDENSIKVNQLECPLEAQYMRIHAWEFQDHPSMRFDLTGCLLTEENSTTDCDFEDGLCGWTQETANDLLYWTRKNYTRTEDSSISVELHEFCSDNCSLLALTTQNYSNSNITFRSTNLIRFFPRSSTPRYLRVWSTVMSITSAYINVTVIGCLQQSAMVSSKIVNISEHGWTPVAVDVRNTDYQLSINGGWKAGDQGYLAIGHILLIAGICPDCDFENDLCNWNNTGIVNWNLTREGSRNFISSEVSFNGTGLARLVGPVINRSEPRMFQTCLRFSYSINGAANNTLWVIVNINGLKTPLWNCAGSSQGWITKYINILNVSEFHVEFEGKVEYGTVNVDDILVLYKTCPAMDNPEKNTGGPRNDYETKGEPGRTTEVYREHTGTTACRNNEDKSFENYFVGGGVVAGIVIVILTSWVLWKRFYGIRGNDAGGDDYNTLDVHYYCSIRNQNACVIQSEATTGSVPESQQLSAVMDETNVYDNI